MLARVRRGHWEQTAGAFNSPAASPCVAQFTTLPLHWAVVCDLTTSADSPIVAIDTLTSDAWEVLVSPLPLVVPWSKPTETSPRRLTLVSAAELEPPVAGSGPVSPTLAATPNAETLNGLAWPL